MGVATTAVAADASIKRLDGGGLAGAVLGAALGALLSLPPKNPLLPPRYESHDDLRDARRVDEGAGGEPSLAMPPSRSTRSR